MQFVSRRTIALAIPLLSLPLAWILFRLILLEPAIQARASSDAAAAGTTQHFPIALNTRNPAVELVDAWTTDPAGTTQLAFLPGDALVHQVSGQTHVADPITATLQMTQAGLCGESLVFSDTLTLPPGSWQHSVPAPAPTCTGIYTTTTRLIYNTYAPTMTTPIVVKVAGEPVFTQEQGFDRCGLPSVQDMQSWWDHSPYYVFNLYLGGIHFACSQNPLDAIWVHQVAEQGWSFTAIWVGPQPPCTNFRHKISLNPAQAYQEGQQEATAAAGVARYLGLFGAHTIHYDIEAYSGANAACRDAVQSFMQGWTDQLHALGLKSGGYGGACSSFLADWHENSPPPDQIWIAHWIRSGYDPNVTVWDAPCVSNDLWPDQQRLKQYAGGHVETWDGVSLTVDSNVFDTSVISWPQLPSAAARSWDSVQDFALLGPAQGWVQQGGDLFWTDNGGQSWTDITPESFEVLSAGFSNGQLGWVVGWRGAGLQVGRTSDGGRTWELAAVDEDFPAQPGVASAAIEVLDRETLWIALRLQSGSSFSPGRLYASQDGGRTWEERSHPLGEPVHFWDEREGWTAGGPAQDQLYHTQNGGRSWVPVDLPVSLQSPLALGLPIRTESGEGWLAAVDQRAGRPRLAFYALEDPGAGWREVGRFTAARGRHHRSLLGMLGPSTLQAGLARLGALPPGTVAVDYWESQSGWVLVQEGECQGPKDPAADHGVAVSAERSCHQLATLLATIDGGENWQPLNLPLDAGR